MHGFCQANTSLALNKDLSLSSTEDKKNIFYEYQLKRLLLARSHLD